MNSAVYAAMVRVGSMERFVVRPIASCKTLPTAHGLIHGTPRIDDLPGPKSYVIVQTPQHWFGYRDPRGKWWIPRPGLHNDQASIPLIAQAVSGIADDSFVACYPHDHCYEFGSRDEYPLGSDGLPDLSRPYIVVPIIREEGDEMMSDCNLAEQIRDGTPTTIQRYLIRHWVNRVAWVVWNQRAKLDGRTPSRFHW